MVYDYSMYTAILFLHIGAALTTAGFIGISLFALLGKKEAWYRSSALSIGAVAAFQIFSGTVLAFLSPELTAAYLTMHVALYLGVCFMVEALLFMRMRKIALVFPFAWTASPVFASVLLFVAAISYGV